MLTFKCMLRSIGLLIAILMTTFAVATPSPSVVISDNLLGATALSYFVIRSTTIQPPSYYEYSKRVEFIEFSIETGRIENRCLVRETAFETDLDAPTTSWIQKELTPPACHPFEILSQKGANYIEPERVGPNTYLFRLDEDGLSFQNTDNDDKNIWSSFYSLDHFRERATNGTVVDASILPWQVAVDSSNAFSIVGMNDDYYGEPLHKTCMLDQNLLSSRRIEWSFLRMICWAGDDDVDGANFYIPIPNQALRNE